MRRSRLQIWADILRAVQTARRPDGSVRPTNVQSRVNLPHDRFWRHVAELEARGLLRGGDLAVTRKGDVFLQESRRIQEFLERFGLGEEGFGPVPERDAPAPAPRPAVLANHSPPLPQPLPTGSAAGAK